MTKEKVKSSSSIWESILVQKAAPTVGVVRQKQLAENDEHELKTMCSTSPEYRHVPALAEARLFLNAR